MNLSNAKATFGLNARAIPTSTSVSGSVQIGDSNVSLPLVVADVAYSLRAIFAGGDALVVNVDTGITTGSTAWVAGVAQVATAGAVGTVTTAGNLSIIITADGMTGSPLTIPVAVLLADTAAMWAAKARGSLASNAAVSVMFSVSGAATEIVLTRKPTLSYAVPTGTLNLYAANDATLNIEIAALSTGITSDNASDVTTAGVLTDGVKIYDDATDFEGITLPAIVTRQGMLFQNNGAASLSVTGENTYTIPAAGAALFTGDAAANNFTITSAASTDLTITVIGSTI